MKRIKTSPSENTKKRKGPLPRFHNHKDYISNLPDDVCGAILSCLSLKAAVRTCVLSKEWEFRWTSIYKVNINNELSRVWENEPSFNIVERVIRRVQNVKQFRLVYHCREEFELRCIEALISAVLKDNLECVELEISTKPSLKFDMYVPCSFPNLKRLSLQQITILNEISDTDTLRFTFPVLKILELKECSWEKVKFVEIYAPSLCTMISKIAFKMTRWREEYCIKVIGAKISKFVINHPENIVMIDSTVACAHFRFQIGEKSHLFYGSRARTLLEQISNLTELSTCDGLLATIQKQPEFPLPTLFQLKRLRLLTPNHMGGIVLLLHAAPLLKFLEIDLGPREHSYDFDSVEHVPPCVVHHLEKVMLDYSSCIYPDFHVEKFLVEKGAQLKTVVIKGHPKMLLPEMANALLFKTFSAFTNASACLDIVGPWTV